MTSRAFTTIDVVHDDPKASFKLTSHWNADTEQTEYRLELGRVTVVFHGEIALEAAQKALNFGVRV